MSEVLFGPLARKSIKELAEYLSEEIKMPETARNYANKMIDFGIALAKKPSAHAICRNRAWAKRKLRCATFDKKWVFAYRQNKTNLVIYHIKHGKLISDTA